MENLSFWDGLLLGATGIIVLYLLVNFIVSEIEYRKSRQKMREMLEAMSKLDINDFWEK